MKRIQLALFLAISVIESAFAQTPFPARPVRLLSWGAGTFPNVVCRKLAEKLGPKWGQAVVVDNRPGAGGIVAAEAAVQAPADGHTLVFSGPVGWHMYLKYEAAGAKASPLSSLTPVNLVFDAPLVVMVNPKLPVKTLQDLVSHSRAAPNPLFAGVGGKYSLHHLALELLAMKAGINMQVIAYKSTPEVAVGVAGGEVAIGIAGIPPIQGLLKDGRLRAVAWTGAQRFDSFSSIPTVAESGVPDFAVGVKAGFHAHKGTSRDLIQRLSRDLNAAVKELDVTALIMNGGARAITSTPEEFERAIQGDIEMLEVAARQIAARGN